MKTILKLIGSLALSGLIIPNMVHATAGGNMNTTTYSCAGQNVTCKQSMNAVGDRLQIAGSNEAMASAVALGAITQARPVSINLPAVGQMQGFTFIPTQGDLARQPINILMVGQKGSAQIKGIVKFYRQLTGERVWTEVGSLVVNDATDDLENLHVSITLAPNGIVTFRQQNGVIAQIFAGDRVLGRRGR